MTETEISSLARCTESATSWPNLRVHCPEWRRLTGNRKSPTNRYPFRPALAEGFQAIPTVTVAEPAVTARSVREIVKKRRWRERFPDAELFADPAWGHFARFESGRPRRAKCLGIEPLHSRSRAPHNCSSLDHRDDRERNAGAAARSRRCAQGIY